MFYKDIEDLQEVLLRMVKFYENNDKDIQCIWMPKELIDAIESNLRSNGLMVDVNEGNFGYTFMGYPLKFSDNLSSSDNVFAFEFYPR